MTESVIISGVRIAIGNYGEALQDIPVARLGGIVIKEPTKRAGL
jgi:acetyl-CoA C-acetyltransferase